MTDEKETNHAFARSRSNDGLELLPCPFCEESKPVLMDFQNEDSDDKVYDVMCCFCGMTTRIFSSKMEAINFWNTRSNV